MIRYDNSNQLMLLLRTTGSVLPECLPYGIAVFTLGLTISLVRHFIIPEVGDHKEWVLADSFGLKLLLILTGYLLVMRTNMALGRWMDGMSEVQKMLSKWGDAFCELRAFYVVGKCQQHEVQSLMFCARVAHWFSLMSCLAFNSLRGGCEGFGDLDDVPVKVLSSNDRASDLRELSMLCRTSNLTPAPLHYIPVPRHLAGWMPSADSAPVEVREKSMLRTMSRSATKTLSRVRRARFSTMQGRVGLRAPSSVRPRRRLRHAKKLDLFVLAPPSTEELQALDAVSDKVNLVCLWIAQAIHIEIRQGRLDAPEPVITRIFENLSTGMLGFNQSYKVAMVPFPFPFAQMVSVCLLALNLFLPFCLDAIMRSNIFVAPLASAIISMCYHGLNSIAIELEEPFGLQLNAVDIEDRQEDFITMLADILRQPMCPPLSGGKLERDVLSKLARNSLLLRREICRLAVS